MKQSGEYNKIYVNKGLSKLGLTLDTPTRIPGNRRK